jgi:hypothetical protein
MRANDFITEEYKVGQKIKYRKNGKGQTKAGTISSINKKNGYVYIHNGATAVDTQDIISEAVVPGNFGSGSANPGIEIPQGYDSFYTKDTGSGKAAHIIGVKSDGTEKQLSTAQQPLADYLVRYYNSGKDAIGMQPMSMSQAFGSEEYNILDQVGIKFTEKPWSFEDLDDEAISEIEVAKAKKALRQNGYELKTYPSKKIFGFGKKPIHSGPMKDVKWKPEENVFIIQFDNGDQYIVDKQGASAYIRFWRAIKG